VETKLVIYWRKIHYFNIPRFNGKFILFLGKDDESSRWKNNKFLLFDGKFNKWKLWVFFFRFKMLKQLKHIFFLIP
jgi:hypothetical protein